MSNRSPAWDPLSGLKYVNAYRSYTRRNELIVLAALEIGSATLAPVSRSPGSAGPDAAANELHMPEAMLATDEAAKYRVSQTTLSVASSSATDRYGPPDNLGTFLLSR